MKLSDIEKYIILALAENDSEKESILQQISFCEVVDRDYSGVGVFTKFKIDSVAAPLDLERKKLEDFPACYLAHPKLKAGAGVILWLSNGFLDTLECFTYEGDWPENEALFEIKT